MSDQAPNSQSIMKTLFQTFIHVRDLAPWEWMKETDIFGVQNPDTGALGFVSIMGMAGEHYAVAVYQEAEGLYGFMKFEKVAPISNPLALFNIPQLQASLEDRDSLTAKDRALIKQLDLKFRGKNAWPAFRSYRPGYYPWYIETAEAQFLIYAMEQLLDVAPRFKKNRTLLPNYASGHFLVRVPENAQPGANWHDTTIEVAPPKPQKLSISVEPALMEQVRHLQPVENTLELDFFMLHSPVQNGKDDRPYYPHALMMVEQASGMITTMDMIGNEDTNTPLWSQVPERVLRALLKLNVLPAIQVDSQVLYDVLAPYMQKLGISLKKVRRLPNLDSARKEFLQIGF